jgi:hypothetical protein
VVLELVDVVVPLLNNTHVFSGDEVETVEEMGWPMRVLTIELEDGQQ